MSFVERNYYLLLSNPSVFITAGTTLLWGSFVQLLAGALGKMATVMPGTILTIAGQTPSAKTLAEIYPGFPTWWIPETVIATIAVCALATLGLSIARYGHQLKHFLEQD